MNRYGTPAQPGLRSLVPSPACGRGWSEGPGEGKLGQRARFSDGPSLPACGGTLSRTRERGTSAEIAKHDHHSAVPSPTSVREEMQIAL
ncbi:hypothetical protein WQQ_36990 [Hydrocarboniphaga effusa AP103]|uniref:Uncharacterized protein n=1 Tax=Hydrocarboniphaga effusa AP103 TaxID=1172194 RepID=I7Z9L9_9GAMM|nr:hypothetical protein WQQ_36990 [Hydrocarboniphaga effusa AP103]